MLGMTLSPCCPYQPRRSVSPHQSLATIHAAFARKVRARPSGCSTLEAIWVHLRYGPVARLPSLRDGFVNRLQDYQFPSFLLFKLRDSGLLPRWDSHPLFMPAFAGRTLNGLNPPGSLGHPPGFWTGDHSAQCSRRRTPYLLRSCYCLCNLSPRTFRRTSTGRAIAVPPASGFPSLTRTATTFPSARKTGEPLKPGSEL